MSFLFPLRFFVVANDGGPAGGAPSAEADDDDGEENPPDPAAEQNEPPREPTVGERVQAILRSRGGLQAQANDLSQRVNQLESSVQSLTTERDAAVQRAEAAEARVTEYETELARLEGEARTVSQGVADEMAQMGIPERMLPEESSQGSDPQETIEQLEARLEKTTDPKAAGIIAKKLKALEEAQ